MGSIPDDATLQPCHPRLEQAARRVALELTLPWDLAELRAAGFDGVRACWDESADDPVLGVPFEQRAWKWIAREARAKGEGLRATADACQTGACETKMTRPKASLRPSCASGRLLRSILATVPPGFTSQPQPNLLLSLTKHYMLISTRYLPPHVVHSLWIPVDK
jgi:hypothetical protein